MGPGRGIGARLALQLLETSLTCWGGQTCLRTGVSMVGQTFPPGWAPSQNIRDPFSTLSLLLGGSPWSMWISKGTRPAAPLFLATPERDIVPLRQSAGHKAALCPDLLSFPSTALSRDMYGHSVLSSTLDCNAGQTQSRAGIRSSRDD